jgi:hypothetical protein
MTAAAVSIGIMRDDGDFQILATLNNNDNLLGADLFQHLIAHLCETLTGETGDLVEAIERQDAPDYVNTDPDSWAT